jgi:CheY-like chemotaxis protein
VKLLIVDDNPINQKFLSYSLTKYFEITTALNGQEALSILNNFDFDVVLMDLSMPVMDGAEATRRIRQSLLFRNRHIPIIFVSTNDFDEERQRCLDLGGDDYLVKPINMKELRISIDYLLKQKLDITWQEQL